MNSPGRHPGNYVLLAFLAIAAANPLVAAVTDEVRLAKLAQNVTIIRDDWGIAHVYGKTDADTVFGAIYAQAEDDFNRVESNYLTSLGRTAEAEGESKVIQDLRQKLFIDPLELRKLYGQSPVWLQRLMTAWADGLNFYLLKHPAVKPKAISRFEPWMALSFSEGSIGGDIEKINLAQLEALYSKVPLARLEEPADSGKDPGKPEEPKGSNGMAISPAITRNHHALLLINPHTSFFFRSELQMVSQEGLNAYGASTWGQFFLYQGFSEKVGWMHTSSQVDAIDEYLETIQKINGRWMYKFGNEMKPVTVKEITVPYRTATGMAEKKFTVYYTQHGPVVRQAEGKWVSFSIMQEPLKALEQSYLRTKATDYKSYKQTLELFANSSNNTLFASAQGDVAYFHGNYIPRRDPKFDWTKPVDGSDPATEYKGLLKVDEAPNLLNPKSGWLYNSNNWPWSAAGPSSLKQSDYPAYVDNGHFETARGLHAIRVLSDRKDFTLESLLAAAFDSYLPWFAKTVPSLLKAWDSLPSSNSEKAATAEQIALLRNWDFRWGVTSVETSLAVFWGEEIQRRVSAQARTAGMPAEDFIASQATRDQLVQALSVASAKITSDFGTWKTAWGEINRFQRLTSDIVQRYDDTAPSTPVAFPSATWGSLASFGARAYPGTKKWYGNTGNSFVAVVEFGAKVRAVAVTAGGESGDVKSKHFNDQAARYATGNLREVYFYRDQLKGHTEKEYHPGN